MNGNPPKISGTKKRPLLIAGGVMIIASLLLFYYVFDPATSIWAPKCIFHQLTGLKCPGCGSQRFIHAILHGDFESAFRANALLITMIPYLAFWGAVELMPRRFPKLRRKLNSIPAIIIILAILLLWTIIRNI